MFDAIVLEISKLSSSDVSEMFAFKEGSRYFRFEVASGFWLTVDSLWGNEVGRSVGLLVGVSVYWSSFFKPIYLE